MAKDNHEARRARSFFSLAPWAAFAMLFVALSVAVLPMTFSKSVSGAEGEGTPPSRTAASDRVPRPHLIEAGLGEHCVEPIPVIRRRHPEFLLHQRDRTVYFGIRGERHSLTGCIDCHAARDEQGQWLRIDAPGQFCESCHSYVAVELDCFGCHSALPRMAFEEGNDEGRERGEGG